MFLAVTKQLYERSCLSVNLPVCPSQLFHYVPVIILLWNFQLFLPLTKVMSMQKIKVRGQRSKPQRPQKILCQFWHFRAVTPIGIHRWLWNVSQSLMWYRRGALFFKVICQIWRSHWSKNRQLWPKVSVSRLKLQFQYTDGYKIMKKCEVV